MDLTPIELSPDDRNVVDPANRPFICRPEQPVSDRAALLIHGFTGSPWEMAPLARALGERGITSLAVRLPGHGSSPEDLAGRQYQEWVDTVLAGARRLQEESRQLVAVGLSTGAMIALASHLTRRFDGLVLLSPYLKFRHRLAAWAGLLRFVIPYQRRVIAPGDRPHYYDKRPLAAIHQLNLLVRKVRPQLPVITVPTLVACAEGDQTVDPESAVALYHYLGSPVKELHRFGPEVPHVLTTAENPRQREVIELVGRFIEGGCR